MPKNPYDDIVDSIIKHSKQILQEVANELTAHYADNMGEDIGAAAFREGGTVRGRTMPKNTRTGVGTLRVVSGDLSRALESKQAGNITKITVTADEVSIESGVDLDIIPYARIHEYGGTAGRNSKIPARPYLNPGIADYHTKTWPKKMAKLLQLAAKDHSGS